MIKITQVDGVVGVEILDGNVTLTTALGALRVAEHIIIKNADKNIQEAELEQKDENIN